MLKDSRVFFNQNIEHSVILSGLFDDENFCRCLGRNICQEALSVVLITSVWDVQCAVTNGATEALLAVLVHITANIKAGYDKLPRSFFACVRVCVVANSVFN